MQRVSFHTGSLGEWHNDNSNNNQKNTIQLQSITKLFWHFHNVWTYFGTFKLCFTEKKGWHSHQKIVESWRKLFKLLTTAPASKVLWTYFKLEIQFLKLCKYSGYSLTTNWTVVYNNISFECYSHNHYPTIQFYISISNKIKINYATC